MAEYVRNLEATEGIRRRTRAGANQISVWFDDLAERDVRYFFELDYLSGPAAEQALPLPCPPETAAALEAALDQMHFERSDLRVRGGRTGDLGAASGRCRRDDHHRGRLHIDRGRPPGSPAGWPPAQPGCRSPMRSVLPADFRHFHVNLSAGGFTASRVFGVEICHVRAPGTRAGRTRRPDRGSARRDRHPRRTGHGHGAGAARLWTGRPRNRSHDRSEPARHRRLPRLRRFPFGAASLVPYGLCR